MQAKALSLGDFLRAFLGGLWTVIRVLWLIGATIGAGYLTSNWVIEASIPVFGEETRVVYGLPYLPASVVLYQEYTNKIYDPGGLFVGGAGGLGSPDAKPYTLERFRADATGTAVYLVIGSSRARDHNERPENVYATYNARLSDGTVIHFTRILGDGPSGRLFGRYQMAGNETVHPEIVDGRVSVPFVYVRDLLSMTVVVAIAGFVGLFVAIVVLEIVKRRSVRTRSRRQEYPWLRQIR